MVAGLLHGFSCLRLCRTIGLDLSARGPDLHRAMALPVNDTGDILPPPLRFADQTGAVLRSARLENPATVLSRPEFAARLDDIEARFQPDLMLFDGPAVLEGGGYMALAPLLDATLLVARAHHTHPDDLSRSRDRVEQFSNLLGVTLNATRHPR